jgi:hypothetical protein
MKTKTILITLILAVSLLATACPSRVKIGNILANPSKYTEKDVVIAGRVTNSFGIAMLGGIYKLDDGTGSIWIVTNKGVPSKGAEVGLKGRVQEGVNYGGRSYGLGVVEEERRVK